jgi:hypothetical protein
MSNAERRLKNVEVKICIRTGILLEKDLGTLYLSCLPQAGTSYKNTAILIYKTDK